jgi:hypothetical protein
MVAAKLSEVAGKGWEWYSGGQAPKGSAVPQAPAPAPAPSPSYWNYAQESLQQAADQTYFTFAGVVSSVYPGSDYGGNDPMETPVMENLPARKSTTNSLLTSPTLLNMFHNPYVSIRGGRCHQAYPPSQSMEAVRSLLSVVPASTEMVTPDEMSLETSSSHGDSVEGSTENKTSWITSLTDRGSRPSQQGTAVPITSSTSETASQLAEGTLRAFRDIALDEAVELHGALRYWSYRWERPLLSWLEAGPTGKHYMGPCSQSFVSNCFLTIESWCVVSSLVLGRRIPAPSDWSKSFANSGGIGSSMCHHWRSTTTFVASRLATRCRTVGCLGRWRRMGCRGRKRR